MYPISVIIPSYNRKVLLQRALDSVINQSYPAKEIIVIDDGSTDGTAGMLRDQYPQVSCLSRSHSGVSAARNAGIRAAQYEWIALLDSDDAWHPQKLSVQIKMFAENREYKLAHTDEIWIRNGKQIRQLAKHKKRGGYIFEHCLPICAMSPSSVIIHRNIFSDVGLFDESLPACEDYDLWLRICCKYPVLFSEEKLTFKYGGHDDQLSRQHWGMDRYRIRAIAGLLSKQELRESDRELAIVILRKKIGIYLAGARKHGNTELVDEFSALLCSYPGRE